MIGTPVTDLVVHLVVCAPHSIWPIGVEEIVQHEPQIVLGGSCHAGAVVGVRELDHAPREHGCRVAHRQAELDVVTGVEPAAGQVHTNVLAVGERRFLAPIHRPVVALEVSAGPLGLVELVALRQRIVVVLLRQGRRREHGHTRGDHAGSDSTSQPAPHVPSQTQSHRDGDNTELCRSGTSPSVGSSRAGIKRNPAR